MAEYTDLDVPIECAECGELCEGIIAMEQHILNFHREYTAEEAINHARLWADYVYDQIELKNIERAEYFRMYGKDPYAEWDDYHEGK